MRKLSRVSSWLSLLLLILLSGCMTSTREPATIRESADTRAERLLEAGDFAAAGDAYAAAAQTASREQSQDLLMRAAAAYWHGGDIRALRELLPRMEQQGVTLELVDMWRAAALVDEGRIETAAGYLGMPAQAIPPAYRPLLFELRARVHDERDEPLASFEARTRALAGLEQADLRSETTARIVGALMQVESTELERRARALADPLALGFVERELAVRSADPEALLQWRSRFPDHPAATISRDEQLALVEGNDAVIALLLPLSGRLEAIGRAVADGFLAAALDADRIDREVLVFDTQSTSAGALEAARSAVQAAAGVLVGPVDREAVQAVMTLPVRPRVVALNEVTTTADGTLGFPLGPEPEARAVALQMIEQGLDRAAIVRLEETWAERLADSFIESYRNHGGTVVQIVRLGAERLEDGERVKILTGIDASEQRYRRLRSVLNRDLQFEPRRRGDIDALFLAIDPQAAQSLLPQLRLYGASDWPMWSSPQALGEALTVDDEDLFGLRYCDLPWLLSTTERRFGAREVATTMGYRSATALRLFALGFDAFAVANQNVSFGIARHSGLTGELSWSGGGNVDREPACAIVDERGERRLAVGYTR